MYTDTHTHLYLEEFENGGADAVRRAVEVGVGRMIFPNVDLNTVAPMKALAAQFPDIIFQAMGFHPTEVGENWRESVDATRRLLDDGTPYVAVGEIGVDLYWDSTYRREQMDAFEAQCRMAAERGLPVIIHCRNALDETLEVIGGLGATQLSGVFHSFGGTVEDVERIRRVAGDFYFGINGIVTFKNCKVREVLPAIGADRLLLETDSPYLAPVPFRGKRNESAYLVHTAAHVASQLGITPDELADITSGSAARLFRLG